MKTSDRYSDNIEDVTMGRITSMTEEELRRSCAQFMVSSALMVDSLKRRREEVDDLRERLEHANSLIDSAGDELRLERDAREHAKKRCAMLAAEVEEKDREIRLRERIERYGSRLLACASAIILIEAVALCLLAM